MSVRGKKKSVVKQMIDDALGKVDNSAFPEDPELQDERQLTGPERFAKGQKSKDEVIIDTQLADIAGKEGYFLKLKKELRPGLGEWMLMKTIETEWRQWADTETEVARIVREHTKIAPTKWGTGPYQIEYACKGGIRGKTYPVRNFWINGEEEFLNPHTVGGAGVSSVDPATQVTAQLDTLGKLLEVTRGFQPPPIDPAKLQEQQAAAFEKGMSIKVGEGNSSNAMVTAMITGLMGVMTAMMTNRQVETPRVVNPAEGLTGMLSVMKDFGVIGQPVVHEKPKSFAETLIELKAIGLDIFKKEDPMEQMGKLKQFASIASDLMGIGGTAERPGILEKIVDMIGPALPGMVKEIADASKNAVQVQVEAGKNIERAKITSTVQPQGTPSMNMAPNATGSTNNGFVANPQITAFFNGLHDATRANNRLYYPIIYASLISDPQGVALIEGIMKETHTAKELIEMLQGYGDPRFKDSEFVMKHLVGYVNGFILWLRDMVKPRAYVDMAAEQMKNPVPTNGHVAPGPGPGYEVECQVCRTIYVLGSVEEFNDPENKVCGNNGCVGVLNPLQKV